jgi:multidrug resistance efflux pump
MLNKTTIRVALGIGFLALLALSVLPRLYLHTSGDGVVNAHTTTLTSPIEGVLAFTAPMVPGKEFAASTVIGTVTNDRVNRSFLHELMTEKAMLDRRVASLAERIAQYTELSRALAEGMAKYQEFSAREQRILIQQEERRLSEEQVELDRAQKEFEANRSLADRDAINRRELERTESNYLKSRERIINVEMRLEGLRNSLAAVEAGTFLGAGHNDAPYSKQRMDQMVIEISLAQTSMDEARSRVAGIDRQIETEQARIRQAECFEIVSPFHALVWRRPLTEGSTVVIDSELLVLLDCASVFLDVAVSESQFANIAPGDQVRYRLIGEDAECTGEVVALRGSGSQLEDRNLAAMPHKDARREFRIWVKADPADLKQSSENFFQVGRRVEIKVPRKWRPWKDLSRMLDVF